MLVVCTKSMNRCPDGLTSRHTLSIDHHDHERRGDEEAQYALAARFCPPPFKKRERCRKCHRAFGVTRYRHHCRHCGESFCQVCLS